MSHVQLLVSRERSGRNRRTFVALAPLAANRQSSLDLALLILLACGVAGCRTPVKPPATTRPTSEQTLTLAELVADVNASNDRIPSLWAKGPFEATFKENPADRGTFVNGDAVTLYLAPDKLRIKGNKPATGTLFDLGSDGKRFWLLVPREDALYTGTFDNLDPELVRKLPVRPDLILQVLAVSPLDADLLAVPSPLLRYNPDADAYMLLFVEPVADAADPPARLAAVREVWYDRPSLLPTLVILFGRDGDPTLRAYLSRHQAAGGESGGPRVATRYNLYFPETGSKLSLELIGADEPALQFKNGRAPLPLNFRPPGADAARQVIDLDRRPPE